MAEKVRVGIIGAGEAGEHHARGYERLKDIVDVVAVCDLEEEKAKDLTDRLGAKKFYRDYHRILDDRTIHAVDIMLPTHLHARVAVEAAGRRKHILCEKPMAISSAECQRMIDAAKMANVILMPVHNQIFFPSHKRAKEIIDSGEIGIPQLYRTHRINSLVPPVECWRGRPDESGGVLMESGIHRVYTSEYLMGRINRVVSVVKKSDERSGDLDTVCAILVFESGALGVFDFGVGVGGGFFSEDCTTIFGSKGLIHVNGCEYPFFEEVPRLKINTQEGWRSETIEDEDYSNSFTGLIENFVKSIKGKAKPMVTGEDAKHIIEIIEQIVRAEASVQA
jgi:UDP-N-acetylglucosamine 3-dehydrogenase